MGSCASLRKTDLNPATLVALASEPGDGAEPDTRRTLDEALLAGQKRVLDMLAKGAALEDVLATLVRLVEHAAPETVGSVPPRP